jgi:glycosyltransferase involved in cell wall biosynthesis
MTIPLRIALAAPYPADPARISGGIRAVAHALVTGFRAMPELEVHVVHCPGGITADETVSDGNITVHRLALPRPHLAPNMAAAVRRTGETLARIRPDMVNAHGCNYAAAAVRSGFPVLWTAHGVVDEELRYNPGLFNRLAFALERRYEGEALVRARDISAISPYIRERFAGRTGARWHVIENPAPEDMFALERRPVRGRLLLPASVIPRKDPITLLEAMALAAGELPELHLQIAGRTNEVVYVSRVLAAIERLGLAGRVELLGVQSQAEMRRRYAEAQLVVLSSREEVSPMSAIEALAGGIPVVTTAAGGAGYIVEDGVTGRVVPVGNAVALAGAIAGALGNAAALAEMGRLARVEAGRRFRLPAIARRYSDVYRHVAGGVP